MIYIASNTDLEELGDEIAELAAHLHAATYRLLVCLREFDELGGWGGGFRSCAHWLSWRTGIAPGAAREKVRVARALDALPQISDAMRRGELSFAKVRAVTRVATRENEADLLELARTGTASHLEKIVRAWRRVDRFEEQKRHETRELSLHIDDDGMVRLRARLDPEVGALLERALAAATEALYGRRPPDPTVDEPTIPQRRADALGLIAECALRGNLRNVVAATPSAPPAEAPASAPVPSGPSAEAPAAASPPSAPPVKTSGRADRFQVVMHVDADALRTPSAAGATVLENGVGVSAETSRRLACDASRVVMAHDAAGNARQVGRRTRTVPAAVRRALEHRDRGCRFPGCGLRFCDAHHVKHWADGGATRTDNLVLLCRRHHRAVHEGGFRVEVAEGGEFRFHRPDDRPLPQAPPAPRLPEDAVARLVRTHVRYGLDIHESTAMSGWAGERLDLDYALLTLRGR